MNSNKEKFLEIYQKLNENQRKAVDLVDGPVLVLAGPGTGKTQILSARIANILLQNNGTDASNILCLTYTEAGKIAMRKRLIQMIGSEAQKVNIHTFHSFCKTIIDENKDIFNVTAEWQPLEDIEAYEILNQLILELPSGHILKDFKDSNAYTGRSLKFFFEALKKESIAADEIINASTEYSNDLKRIVNAKNVDEIPDLEDYARENDWVYKKKTSDFVAGDIKRKIVEKKLESSLKTLAASELYVEYQSKLKEYKRYDFQDMITWVVNAFETNQDLLLDYQENLLYFLVDEFQDTNGAQLKILELLTDSEFSEEPNIFVVGDDDQSIYSFQGAQYNRIQHFIKHFKISSERVVVLDKNYRSAQEILDASNAVIENNRENRVVSDKSLKSFIGDGLTKALKAEGVFANQSNAVKLLEFDTPIHIAAGVAEIIKNIQNEQQVSGKGTLSDIAIISNKHSDFKELEKALSFNKIPYFLSKEENLLEDPLVEKMLDLLTFFCNLSLKPHLEGNTSLLFKILNSDFLELNWLDIQKFNIAFREYSYKNPAAKDQEAVLNWLKNMQNSYFLNSAEVVNQEAFIHISKKIEHLFKLLNNKTLQTFFEEMLSELGIMTYVLNHEQKLFYVQAITVFFDFIKGITANWSSEQNIPNQVQAVLQLDFVLKRIAQMQKYEVPLKLFRLIGHEQGVHFLTAHGSKGLEYEHVILLDVNKKKWEGKSNRNDGYSLPPFSYFTSSQFELMDNSDKESKKNEELEELRRLFFVAMTRAKKELYITYASRNIGDSNAEKSKYEPSVFALEVLQYLENQLNKKALLVEMNQEEQKLLVEFLTIQLAPIQSLPFTMIHEQFIEKRLQNYKLSVTDLGKYLKCPTTFYYEKILQVPTARSMSMGFGNVVHNSLEEFFKRAKQRGQFGTAEELVQLGLAYLKTYHSHFTEKEQELKKEQIERLLPLYYQNYIQDWQSHPDFDTEYKFQNVTWNEIPLSGVLDKIIHYPDNQITIVDYKTGNPKYAKEKLKRPITLMPGEEIEEKNPDKKFEKLYGGDYWRQMAFYKLLIQNNHQKNWRLKPNDTFGDSEMTPYNIYFDLIEGELNTNNELVFERIGMDITDYDVELVQKQINEVYHKIKNKEFNHGCGTCDWCKMVANNFSPFERNVNEEVDSNQI